jgi:hypothetical protein
MLCFGVLSKLACTEVHKVCPKAESYSGEYTLYGWAEWGFEQHTAATADARDWLFERLAPEYMKSGRGNARCGKMQLTNGE